MSGESGGKMWSGRFREPLDPIFEQWQRSFPFDVRLLPQEVEASKAHAAMIEAAGVLTSDELETMHKGLDRIIPLSQEQASQFVKLQVASAAYGQHLPEANSLPSMLPYVVILHPNAEDVHHFVEMQLNELIGPLALKLHTGRSRNEQISTDMRLFVRDSIDATTLGLKKWTHALLALAESVGERVMPSYTHLQRAEPVLVAHWLLAYVAMVERDLSRLRDARARMNFCPLGSGAIAGATLALDRHIPADLLKFSGPTSNSMDATSDRDFMLDFTQSLSTIGLHLSRFAEEVTLHATTEFGFIDLPESFSTGSSAMPQKKNPDLTELIRGKSARLVGASTELAILMKGLPLAYNKDLQQGQEPVFEAADTMVGMLTVLPGFTRALRFRFEQMETAATTGYLNAMAAATYLSSKGVPFRTAHELIGHAVRLGIETNRELGAISLVELQTLSPAFGEDFCSAISLEATLDCHDVVGGTARHHVREALAEAKVRLGFEDE